MNALVIIPPISAVPMCLADAEMAAALSFAEQEKSAGTRRAYGSDFGIFTAWCDARGLDPMPASAGTVARFLSSQATAGLKSSTISRRAAAIAHFHKMNGHEPPGNAESVRGVVRGIRRTVGCAAVRKTAATADLVGRMLERCDGSLIGLRDRALLALGFAGAFRRSELVALEVADLEAIPDGLRVTIRRSKTDQEGQGQEIAIPRGCRIEPVAGRGSVAGGVRDLRGADLPPDQEGRPHPARGAVRPFRRRDRQALRPGGRARSRDVRRP